MDAPPTRAYGRGLTHDTSARDARAWRAALWTCVASGVVRLFIAARTPLFPDETYYWEWSRHLAGGYFDHPPAIAWLTAIGTGVAGVTPLGVRLGSVIAGVVAAFFLCAAARRLAGDRAALAAAVIFAVMPLSAAGLVLATPDAPLFAAAAITCYALIRVLETGPRSRESLRWWCVAGIALGLALASKYTGVLLPAGVFLGFLTTRELRSRLREPGPYIAVAIALAALAPVLAWNAAHDWISIAFQLGHGFSKSSGSAINRELELIGGQAGLVSPILFGLCVMSVWKALRGAESRAVHRLLAVVAVFVFAFFMYSATKRRVEANWPALSYLPALLLTVSLGVATPRTSRWLRAGLGLAAVLTLVVYINAFVPILPVRAARDPAARASGWDVLAQAVARVAPRDSSNVRVAADRYQDASELAFHMPGNPETFALNLGGRANQYDLWPGFADRAHAHDDMLLVLDDTPDTPAQVVTLTPHFVSVERGDVVQLARNGGVVKQLRLWRLRGWRGTWPQAQLRSRS